jgi:catechol 2,3-dioxygenase-like lactoylglutathione lyase family enzyme
MIGYITIGAADTEQSKTFYDSVLATVGWKSFADYGGYIGYGPDGADNGQTIWVCNRSTASPRAPATAS